MAINLNILREEILNDPMNLGFNQYVSIRNDVEVVNLMNQTNIDSNFLIDRGRISKDDFIELTSQIVLGLMIADKNGNEEAKFWLAVFDRLVANSETINCQDSALESVLNELLVANFVTAEQIQNIKTKHGSRAEKLFGQKVSLDDVSNSLNEGTN